MGEDKGERHLDGIYGINGIIKRQRQEGLSGTQEKEGWKTNY
jgi:hypothetical protein